MKIVNIQAAKTQLSRLVEEALEGEEIVLAKSEKPQVTLVPFCPIKGPGRGGQLAGVLPDIPEDFDRSDKEIQKLSEG